MGFSNFLSSALTAVATFSGNPDIQQVANSANDIVVSYQTQQLQDMANRILSSPDGIAQFTEKGQTVWRALQYNANGEIVGFADFATKEEYLLLKQQEAQEMYAEQQRLKAEQAEADRRYAIQYAAQQQKQPQRGDVSIADIDGYGSMLGSLEQAGWNCTQYRDNTPPWDKCMQREFNKAARGGR